jgi:hypothetical protein
MKTKKQTNKAHRFMFHFTEIITAISNGKEAAYVLILVTIYLHFSTLYSQSNQIASHHFYL